MNKLFLKKKKFRSNKNNDIETVDQDENKENYCKDFNLKTPLISNASNHTALASTSTNSLIRPLRSLLNFKHKNSKQINIDKKGNLCENTKLHVMADENQENCQLFLLPKWPENVEDTIVETWSTLPSSSPTKPFRSVLNIMPKNQKQVSFEISENSCDNMEKGILKDYVNEKNSQLDLMPKPLENVEKDEVSQVSLSTSSSIKPFKSLLNYPEYQTRGMIDKNENLCDNMEFEIIETEMNEEKCQLDLIPKPPENKESANCKDLSALPTTSKKSIRSLLNFRHKNARRGNTDGKSKLSDNIGIGISTGEENKENYTFNLMSNPPENVKTTLGEASPSSSIPSTRPLKGLLNVPRIFKQKNNVHFEEHSAAKMKKMSKKTKNKVVKVIQKVVKGQLDLSNRDLMVAPKFNDIALIEELMIYDNRLENIDEIASLIQMKRCFLQRNKIKTIPTSFSQCTLLTIVDLRCNELTEFPECLLLLQHLETLFISRNRISLIPDQLESLQNLCLLFIDQNCLNQIPKTLSKLKRLRIINFSTNKIMEVPTELGDCPSLVKIDMMNNNINNLPESLGNLKQLTRLNARQNQIETVPQSFANFEKVEEFYFHNNRLHSLPDQLLYNFQKLDDVNFSRNCLTTFPTGGPKQFMWTKFLNLSGNVIGCIPMGIFSLAKELIIVNLSDNCIKTLIPNDVAKWDTIIELDLSCNEISRLPAEIGHLTKMKTLKLSSNVIRRIPPELGQMESLVVLNLEDNQIQELPSEVGNLKNLEKLDLSCNLLESLPTTIGDMCVLKYLNLQENNLKTIPPEIGKLNNLIDLLLKNNADLNSLPEELCLCMSLLRLTTQNCGMKNFPPTVINHGPAVLLHFLARVFAHKRNHDRHMCNDD